MGKSTVAVNLAYELAAQGGRVGLLDLDLYGPSLPVLVQPEDVTIRRSPLGPGAVFPIEHGNVKLLSLGYVNTHVSYAYYKYRTERRSMLNGSSDALQFFLFLGIRVEFREADKTTGQPL